MSKEFYFIPLIRRKTGQQDKNRHCLTSAVTTAIYYLAILWASNVPLVFSIHPAHLWIRQDIYVIIQLPSVFHQLFGSLFVSSYLVVAWQQCQPEQPCHSKARYTSLPYSKQRPLLVGTHQLLNNSYMTIGLHPAFPTLLYEMHILIEERRQGWIRIRAVRIRVRTPLITIL